jgi:hypothetical protein
MKNRQLEIQYDRIKNLFAVTGKTTGGDFELQSHWAKYLCVLSAGFLENAISEVYIDFVRNKAHQPVANYASSMLSNIRNPKTAKFIEVAYAFKKSWGDELDDFVKENGRAEAVNSIMHNRHLIAHGKNSNVTVVRLQNWFETSVEVIVFIENQCAR